MNSIARFAQGPAIEHHIERGGNLASVWNAMGIGFLCAVVCAVAIRFGVSTALFEPGSVVEFNNADEVVYLGAATVDDARFLGEALTRYGVFGAPAGTVVKITASSDMYTISFFFFDKPWEEPDAIAIYEELGEVLADARFGRPFAIELCDENFAPQKTLRDRVKQCRLRRGVSTRSGQVPAQLRDRAVGTEASRR